MDIFKIFLFTLISTSSVEAQNFIEHAINEVVGPVRSLKLNDLDNDGLVDIIAVVNSSAPVIVYFGEGNGNFEDSLILENQNSSPARDINFLDINNDNILDIICIINDELVYYINNGDRTFEDRTLIAFSDPQITSFSVIDFDNNGLEDLVISDGMQDIVYFPNMGNATLEDPITIIETSVRDIIAQDLNNDESIDFLTGIIPELYSNNTDGSFTINESLDDYPNNTQSTTRLHIADLNSDNTIDLLFAHTNFADNNGILWYANQGNGDFTMQTPITSSAIPSNLIYRIINTADFNNDGNVDIIAGISNSFGNGIPIWLNDGNNNFGEPEIVLSDNDAIDTVEIFDFNNDNKMDFIIGSNNGTISWFENNITLALDDNRINNLRISPNPSLGIYAITSSQNNELFNIQVFNSIGQIVASLNDSNTIDLTHQSSGVYIAKITSQSTLITTNKKLFKL